MKTFLVDVNDDPYRMDILRVENRTNSTRVYWAWHGQHNVNVEDLDSWIGDIDCSPDWKMEHIVSAICEKGGWIKIGDTIG